MVGAVRGQRDPHAATRTRSQAQCARALGDRQRDPVAVVAPLELDDAAVGPRAQSADERAHLLRGHLRLLDEAHEAPEI